MGETGRNEVHGVGISSSPQVDLADEMSLAMKACASSSESDVTKDLKRLGQERSVCILALFSSKST